MTRITVTIPPEMRSISGFLLKKALYNLINYPSYTGDLILGYDKRGFPIRIGPPPSRVYFDPYLLVSEDLQYLFVSEDSIFKEALSINASIKGDNSGDIFLLDLNGNPIIDLQYNENNWPESLSSIKTIDINKDSPIALFDVNVPRGALFSYSFSDLTTETISQKISYYSTDFGETWNSYSRPFITSLDEGFGRILIYVDISDEIFYSPDETLSFLLRVSVESDITYLTAEYGIVPASSSNGEVFGKDLLQIDNPLSIVRGQQRDSIPYGTFKRCLNDKGLTEFYGESSIILDNGVISYSYKTFESISNRCIK